MAIAATIEVSTGTSLHTLVQGFILTHQTDGKSPKTVHYYRDNLRRFLWYADTHHFPGDPDSITDWQIREFLAYVGSETHRWGLTGRGSETSRPEASRATVRHYFVVLSCFFNWALREGYISATPLARLKIARPKPKVVRPYSADDITRMLTLCDRDCQQRGQFLGSRNKAILLVLLDTGLRLSELAALQVDDIETENPWLTVIGKGRKERTVRIGKTAQKAVWRYSMFRPASRHQALWLTEEGAPLSARGIQILIKRLKERAGVRGPGTVHRFRHTFALSFLRADRNVFNLQYLLGHSDLDMVRRYTSALGMEDALEAHVKASPADHLQLK